MGKNKRKGKVYFSLLFKVDFLCGFKRLIINELNSNLLNLSFLQNDIIKSNAN
jgi:hypothetical protein